MMASRIGNNIAANVAISLGRRVLDSDEIEKCARGVDAELREVRDVLDGLRGRYVKNCWCSAGDDAEHYVSCQRARALMEKLELK